MLTLNKKALVKAVSLRKEFHGEDRVKAITIALVFEGVAVSVVEAAFVNQLSLLFKDGDPQLEGIAPLRVTREIGNVDVTIDGVKIKGMDVSDVELTLVPGDKIDVALKLKGRVLNAMGIGTLWDALEETVKCQLKEMQHRLEEAA